MSSSSICWQKVVAVVGGSAAAAALLWHLHQQRALAAAAALPTNRALKVLKEIQESQEHMKELMKDLVQQLMASDLTFEETYKLALELQPEDPLAKHGLTLHEFDELLQETHDEPCVREAMAAHTEQGEPSSKVSDCTVAEMVEIHRYMLDELRKVVADVQKDTCAYEIKTVMIAAQAIVGAKVEAKFGYSTEDIEACVHHMHTALSVDPDFATVNVHMQGAMNELMSSQIPAVVDETPAVVDETPAVV